MKFEKQIDIWQDNSSLTNKNFDMGKKIDFDKTMEKRNKKIKKIHYIENKAKEQELSEGQRLLNEFFKWEQASKNWELNKQNSINEIFNIKDWKRINNKVDFLCWEIKWTIDIKNQVLSINWNKYKMKLPFWAKLISIKKDWNKIIFKWAKKAFLVKLKKEQWISIDNFKKYIYLFYKNYKNKDKIRFNNITLAKI